MTRDTPSRSRIRRCSGVTALAMIVFVSRDRQLHDHEQARLDVLAIETTATSTFSMPAALRARSSVASSSICLRPIGVGELVHPVGLTVHSDHVVSQRLRVVAMADPNRPSPMTRDCRRFTDLSDA